MLPSNPSTPTASWDKLHNLDPQCDCTVRPVRTRNTQDRGMVPPLGPEAGETHTSTPTISCTSQGGREGHTPRVLSRGHTDRKLRLFGPEKSDMSQGNGPSTCLGGQGRSPQNQKPSERQGWPAGTHQLQEHNRLSDSCASQQEIIGWLPCWATDASARDARRRSRTRRGLCQWGPVHATQREETTFHGCVQRPTLLPVAPGVDEG